MKAKKYKSKEKPLPRVEEPVALDDKPEEFDACYAKLKAEADEKFGVKEYMTVEEYFGKLRYMVERLYDTVSTSSEERKAQFLKLAGSWPETVEGEEHYQMMKHRNEVRPSNRNVSFPQE